MSRYRRINGPGDLAALHASEIGFVMDPFNRRVHCSGCGRVATLGLGAPKWYAEDGAALDEYQSWRATFPTAKPLRPCGACLPTAASAFPLTPAAGSLRTSTVRVPAVRAGENDLDLDGEQRYVLRQPAGADRSMEVWMASRLSYDNKPSWQQTLVSLLRSAVASIQWRPEDTLSGVFATADRTRCDAENLLFYNVGAASFSGAPRRLTFERADEMPDPPSPLVETALGPYYHAYRALQGRSEFTCWQQSSEPLVVFANVPVGSITGDQAGRLVWWWMRQAEDFTIVRTPPLATGETFGLRIRLTVPSGGAVKLAGVVKGLFDGVIGSLHRGMQDGDITRGASLLFPKIASVVPSEEALKTALASELTQLLTGPAFKVHRTWTQLHPADHLCVAGAVELRVDADARGRLISGEVFSVSPRS